MTTDSERAAELAKDERAWTRVLWFWHLAFYVLVLLTAASLLATAPDDRRQDTVVSLGALALLVVAYLTMGRRAADANLGPDDPHGAGPRGRRWYTAGYLTVLFVVTSLVSGLAPMGTMLLFIAFSQTWLLVARIRNGIVLCVVLTVMTTVAVVYQERDDGGSVWVIVIQMALGFTFSLLLGLWLHLILRQGSQRAELLAKLQRTQAELSRTQHAAGVTAERERVSREIHDTLAQGFTSIVLLSQTALTDLERQGSEDLRRRLELIERTARDNLAEARALVVATAPAALHEASLTQALRRLAEQVEAESGIRVRCEIGEVPSMPSAIEVVLLRAAQESLSNVRRHSGAGAARLSLDCSVETVTLGVEDDGTGLPLDTVEGFGLRGMRERVALSGGTVTVVPVPTAPVGAAGVVEADREEGPVGTGTRVTVRVPLPRATGTTNDAVGPRVPREEH